MNEVLIAIICLFLGVFVGFFVGLYFIGKNIGGIISDYLTNRIIESINPNKNNGQIKTMDTVLPSNGNPPPPPKPKS